MRRHGGPCMHVTERDTPVGKGRLPCGAAIGCSGKGKRDGEKVGGGQELGRRERREEDTGVSREAILRGTAWWVHVSGRLSTHRAGIAPRGALCTARTLRDGRVSGPRVGVGGMVEAGVCAGSGHGGTLNVLLSFDRNRKLL